MSAPTDRSLPTTSYHQQHNLLFQFILSELILVHRELKQLENLLQSPLEPNTPALTIHMTNLAGSTQSHLRIFSWSDDGMLTKLRYYTALLCQTNPVHDSMETSIDKEANESWLLAMQVLDTIRVLRRTHTTAPDIADLKAACKKLTKSIKRLANLVAEAIIKYHDDENVIFFLVRHHRDLGDLYENPSFVPKLLRKMFPKKLDGVQTFLTQSYQARGFHHLVPVIQEKLAEIENLK